MPRVLVRGFTSRQAVPNEATDKRVIGEHHELAAAIRERDVNQACDVAPASSRMVG